MKLQVRVSTALAVLALVVALSGVSGTLAAQHLITGAQIKNNSITTKDLRNGGVKTADIANGTVDSEDLGANSVGSEEITPDAVGTEELAPGAVHTSDIGADQVTANDVDLPEPVQMVEAPAPASMVGPEFTLVDEVGTYTKEDPTSKLQVAWTGSASAGFSPCQFQIRVDGKAAGDGAGVAYLQNSSTLSVSDTALFEGLGSGAHQIQVFARSLNSATAFPCTVGPAEAAVDQTFVVTEEVG